MSKFNYTDDLTIDDINNQIVDVTEQIISDMKQIEKSPNDISEEIFNRIYDNMDLMASLQDDKLIIVENYFTQESPDLPDSYKTLQSTHDLYSQMNSFSEALEKAANMGSSYDLKIAVDNFLENTKDEYIELTFYQETAALKENHGENLANLKLSEMKDESIVMNGTLDAAAHSERDLKSLEDLSINKVQSLLTQNEGLSGYLAHVNPPTANEQGMVAKNSEFENLTPIFDESGNVEIDPKTEIENLRELIMGDRETSVDPVASGKVKKIQDSELGDILKM